MFGDIRDLVWSALKDGARQAGEPFEFDNLTVGDWMDENPAKIIAETLTELVGSLPTPTENGAKKKVKRAKSV